MSGYARRLQRSTVLTGGGFIANVINNPSAAGYPDATNSGVPTGVTLTNSGSVNVTTNGAVIQNLNISGQIIIRANNVTIRNCRITSGDYYPIDYEGTGLLVEDTEIIGTSSVATAGISFSDYTARRVSVTGCADGFKANANVLIEDCYTTGLWITAESHNDGVQAFGGSNVIVRHSTFKLGGTSCEIFQFNDSNSDWLIENNLLDGGGWVFNAGSVPNLTIRNNRFSGTRVYGIGDVSGATYTGNYYDSDGSPATPGAGH